MDAAAEELVALPSDVGEQELADLADAGTWEFGNDLVAVGSLGLGESRLCPRGEFGDEGGEFVRVVDDADAG